MVRYVVAIEQLLMAAPVTKEPVAWATGTRGFSRQVCLVSNENKRKLFIIVLVGVVHLADPILQALQLPENPSRIRCRTFERDDEDDALHVSIVDLNK